MPDENIFKEDILNVTGNIFESVVNYVESNVKTIECLMKANQQLKCQINKTIEFIKDNSIDGCFASYTDVGELLQILEDNADE